MVNITVMPLCPLYISPFWCMNSAAIIWLIITYSCLFQFFLLHLFFGNFRSILEIMLGWARIIHSFL
uniref:Uncharacterized protein n=1 Tax=Arundo donax TaxID=35708 RepID=A0A0A9D8D2_ARUDO